jgi:hypothetical protein
MLWGENFPPQQYTFQQLLFPKVQLPQTSIFLRQGLQEILVQDSGEYPDPLSLPGARGPRARATPPSGTT